MSQKILHTFAAAVYNVLKNETPTQNVENVVRLKIDMTRPFPCSMLPMLLPDGVCYLGNSTLSLLHFSGAADANVADANISFDWQRSLLWRFFSINRSRSRLKSTCFPPKC
jgi:hypothetical protein